jgi:aldose 1-epimerase
MFSINKIPFGETHLLEIRNPDTNEYVTVLPEIGGSLHQVCLSGQRALHPLLWAVKNSEELYSEGISQYMGALLFPFVDRIEKGRYVFEGVEYNLLCNESNLQNALHGFVSTKPFHVLKLETSCGQGSVTLCFEYNGAVAGFPFPFIVTVRYVLTAGEFSCHTHVQNTGSKNMPVGIGWHPYFQIGEDISQYQVKVPANTSFVITDAYINTGAEMPFDDAAKFLELKYNYVLSVYALNQINHSAKTILRDKKRMIDIAVNTTGFPFLQLYLVAGKGLAIEPLTCIGNAFNNGIGLTVLSPEEVMETSFSVSVKDID